MNKDRLLNEFLKLISFDSPSYNEDEIAFYLYDKLKELGLLVSMDNGIERLTNRKTKAGNIYGLLKGNIEGEPILFSSHMDTVNPAKGKKAIIENGIVKSNGNAVLGADDITGIAEIIEMLTVIKENNLKHPDIEVVFFVAEEPYCRGSSVFDFKRIKSKYGYVLDLSGDVGTIAIEAPSIYQFKIIINGKSAHAGFEPEKGISAIEIASKAISKLMLGRIDSNTTLNIGTINGGDGKNIIPNKVVVEGEIRSLDDNKALHIADIVKDIFEKEADNYNTNIDFELIEMIKSYKLNKNSIIINTYKDALSKIDNSNAKVITTFGGSDANNFNKNGIECAVISNAMKNIHTTEEYFELEDFYKAANILIALATR